MKGLSVATIALLTLAGAPVSARVTPAEYRAVGIDLTAQATLPLAQAVTDSLGARRRLGEIIRRPAVLVFADYTCRTLCGPILAFVASALEGSRLRAGEEFQLVVVGLDPKDGKDVAAAMRERYVTANSALGRASTFITADEASIAVLTKALGYRYQYDAEDDTYIHPAAVYVLRTDGRVSRVLTGIGISADDLRLALVEASGGKIGTFSDRVRLLCSGFDPAHGMYNLLIGRLLSLAAGATIFTLAAGIVFLLLAGRRTA